MTKALRRSNLTRRTELARTPMRRGAQARLSRAKRAATVKRSNTGPTAAQRRLVAERAGFACELCGIQLHDGTDWSKVHSFHHRQPRGMGGSSRTATNDPTNILLLCGSGTTGCHGIIEQQRTMARAYGWIVPHPTDPATVPVHIAGQGTLHDPLVLLTSDGHYQQLLD